MKKKLIIVARTLLGLVFLLSGIFGLYMYYAHVPFPPPPNPIAQAFFDWMMQSGYFFQLLKITELVCGGLLVAGLYAPLAMVILAPVVLNIVFFHRFIVRGGPPIDLICLLLFLFVMYGYRNSFKVLLTKKSPL